MSPSFEKLELSDSNSTDTTVSKSYFLDGPGKEQLAIATQIARTRTIPEFEQLLWKKKLNAKFDFSPFIR